MSGSAKKLTGSGHGTKGRMGSKLSGAKGGGGAGGAFKGGSKKIKSNYANSFRNPVPMSENNLDLSQIGLGVGPNTKGNY